MRYTMPNPELINTTYYLRLHVPSDVATKARGTAIAIPVGDAVVHTKVGAVVKVSLRTKQASEAKRRFVAALAAVEAHWDALRQGPVELTHKQCVALAGEVYHAFIRNTDDNPASPEIWERVGATDNAARQGKTTGVQSLLVDQPQHSADQLMDRRFGGLTDALLLRRGLIVDRTSRQRVIGQVAQAMEKATGIILRKAQGDYSESGDTNVFPEFEPTKRPSGPSAAVQPNPAASMTMKDVIDEQVMRRSLGSGAKPLPQKSVNKFVQVAREFAAHRNSDDATNITAREIDSWMVSLMREGKLTNTTIAQRIFNLGTVIEWTRKLSHGELYVYGNPVKKVTPPVGQSVRSEDRTMKLDEARTILLASRKQAKPELRWVPWLLAYSGARVNEIAQLTANDFFRFEGRWFYRITSEGGKRVKVEASIRRVPIHPDVIAEGFLSYLTEKQRETNARLFPVRTIQNLHKWIRNDLKLDRKELAPNHGWRHLFEDLALLANMNESAKRYITGRTTGHSSEGYGKSDAALLGLAEEMDKVGNVLRLAGRGDAP